jgi:hypothetical protein
VSPGYGAWQMPYLLCWFLHRTSWTILMPGLLPLNLDAVAYCPTCDAGRGHKSPQRVFAEAVGRG